MTSHRDKKNSRNNPGYPPNLSIIRLDTTPSTNDYLKSNIKKLQEEFPVMVIAPVQTSGRGRENRSWSSEINLGIYISIGIILDKSENVTFLSAGTAVSVIESLSELAPVEIQLKWPNDIMVHNLKLGGILIENLIQDNRATSVIGIGINLNHERQNFPPELSQKAISMKMITGENHPVEGTVKIISRNLMETIKKIMDNQTEYIIERANHHSRFYLGKKIQFSQNHETQEGLFRGIHHDGGLILESQDGIRQRLYSGEIFLDQS